MWEFNVFWSELSDDEVREFSIATTFKRLDFIVYKLCYFMFGVSGEYY